MYLAEIRIENFRSFGSGERAFKLSLDPGLTALVGENDAGKTAVIDALRYVLGTRDQEQLRVDETDFHRSSESKHADQITIRLMFRDLTKTDRGAFAEFLTYEGGGESRQVCLVLTWTVKRTTAGTSRRAVSPEWRTGANGDGPLLDFGARSLLTATYLRPLRDAERAMSAGRGSRLSQILQHTSEIKDTGVGFDRNSMPYPDPTTLSVLGLGDFANYLFHESQDIKKAGDKLNDEYLKPLSFAKDLLRARIEVAGSRDDAARLRQLLEKLELTLSAATDEGSAHTRGLGSNNLLFMACELLLLAAESDGFPLLLIEEPEAHLHPQRQLRLMAFLQAQAKKVRADGQHIQIIVTTHSPSIASDLCLDSLVLIEQSRAFPLRKGMTKLDNSDYRFLERFLDATKSNLFFARGVMIVEGDAENILMPALARLLNRDFAEYGVSVVNVGGVGLGRYARIFMRTDPMSDGEISVPVACVTDIDVMPDCAPAIVGKVKPGEEIPKRPPSKRLWRVKSEFSSTELAERRQSRIDKASGQNVQTFVAGEWTLEYDLAISGLAKEVWEAAVLALADERIHNGKVTRADAIKERATEFAALSGLHAEALASHVYAKFDAEGASKAVGAQYLAELLEEAFKKGALDPDGLCSKLPDYVIDAIGYVTNPLMKPATASRAPVAAME
ncbi:ATP-dependent endonuclease [Paraburkholderia sp. BR14263]|uniref:ATP-dependent nuclease n=1 Tax=unclassified Paraburkholderia TaxID=2615204 RepID=UPI0034CF57D0